MWPDRVSNPGPLTYKSGALPTGLRSPVMEFVCVRTGSRYKWWQWWDYVNCRTGLEPYPRISQAKFHDETSQREK